MEDKYYIELKEKALKVEIYEDKNKCITKLDGTFIKCKELVFNIDNVKNLLKPLQN